MAALATDGQQHFCGRVHVLQAQLGVEQQRGGGQVVQKQTVLCIADGHKASLTSFGACQAWRGQGRARGGSADASLSPRNCKKQTKAPKRSGIPSERPGIALIRIRLS
ncbi:hypothetical protein D3C77_619050 [compost metagenome]